MIRKGSRWGLLSDCFFLVLDGEHRQVVALLSGAYEGVHGVCHVPGDLRGLQQMVCNQRGGKLHDALVAKLRVIDVLGFVQTVCEEEDGRRLLQRDLLLLEIEVGDDADGQ